MDVKFEFRMTMKRRRTRAILALTIVLVATSDVLRAMMPIFVV